MANRRRRIKQRAFNIGKSLFPALKTATPIIAFVEQLTRKDRMALGASFSSLGTFDQLKTMVNIIGGRTFGVQPFTGTKVTGVVQTINFDNILNQWTTLGLAGIGYKIVGGALNKMATQMGIGNVIPHTSKVGSLAKGAFAGGLLGSIFDAPEGGSSHNTSHLQVTNSPLVVSSARNTFSGSDSTQSGFE